MKKINIHMVDLIGQYSKIKDEVDRNIISSIESGRFVNGPIVKQFSENLSAYLNVKNVIPCANGTDALQTAFMENFAAQCGYCTPGMILAARTLLDSNPSPNREDVIEAISGNICRCTGYEPIIDAILAVAEKRDE